MLNNYAKARNRIGSKSMKTNDHVAENVNGERIGKPIF